MNICKLPCLAIASILAASIQTASAQDMSNGPDDAQPSLWALLNPDLIVQRALQSGMMTLRSQFDLTYGVMDVDLNGSRIGISDIRAWPLFDWENGWECEIAIDHVSVRAAPLNRPDLIRLNLRASGVSVPSTCLPPAQQQGLRNVGLTGISAPLVSIDINYDVASAGAEMSMNAEIDGFAALGLDAEMDYLWFAIPQDGGDPEPVVLLDRASLSVENLGGFAALSQMAPPQVQDPQQSPLLLEGMIGGMLVEMNKGAALTPDQSAFLKSVKTVWPQFLQTRARLVLETQIASGEAQYLDFNGYASDPARIFADLKPVLAVAPAAVNNILPTTLLQQALSGELEGLSDADILRAGTAFVSGLGAPRNARIGAALLQSLAEKGNVEASFKLAETLEASAPEAAYDLALRAAASGQIGANAILNRLEARLPFQILLDRQFDVASGLTLPAGVSDSVYGLRTAARMFHLGQNASRSYPHAYYWALSGAAAGDTASSAILEDLDRWAEARSPEDRALWDQRVDEVSARASRDWISAGMPARLTSP